MSVWTMQEASTKGLAPGSLFKVILIGLGFSLGFFVILMGIFSLFGAETIRIHGTPITGIRGLAYSIFFAPIIVFGASVLNWLVLFPGNWIYTRFWLITLRFREEIQESVVTEVLPEGK